MYDSVLKELARLLSSQSSRFPGKKKVVIAHSHGGNVTMRAMRIWYDAAAADDISLITLATPFVQMGEGELSAFSYLAAKFFLGALMTVIGSLGLIVGTMATLLVVFEFSLITVLVAVISLVFAVAGMWGSRKIDGLSRWVTGSTSEKLAPEMEALCSASTLPLWLSPSQPLLVLRGIDDEAALILAAGSIGARLSRLVIGVLDNLVVISIIAAVFVFVVMILIGVASDIAGKSWLLAEWLHYLFFAIGGMLLIGFPLLISLGVFVSNLFKSAFGRELLHGGISLDVISNSTPDFIGNVDAVTLPSPKGVNTELRHSLYAHPDVTKTIAVWLMSKSSNRMDNLQKLVDSYGAVHKVSTDNWTETPFEPFDLTRVAVKKRRKKKK